KKYQTKFPVARIKKIMQTDEDVGKMSHATPVLISKALELFIKSLCEATMMQAMRQNSKRVSPVHLKQTVQIIEQFDFLKDVVSHIPD
ncbi:histone-fold-containing protein, partial [Conidiobolus coronatus NRRL 28638]